MESWFCKNLGDAMLADPALDQIKALYNNIFAHSPPPEDLVIFVRHVSEGSLHCEVMVYFSPAAATIAHVVDAVSCHRPAPGDLGLLVGSERAHSLLFPPI